MSTPTHRYPKVEGPFHPVAQRVNDKLVGYSIYANNNPLLVAPSTGEEGPRLTRPMAYAIARLLNSQRRFRTWAERFTDPYTRNRQ